MPDWNFYSNPYVESQTNPLIIDSAGFRARRDCLETALELGVLIEADATTSRKTGSEKGSIRQGSPGKKARAIRHDERPSGCG